MTSSAFRTDIEDGVAVVTFDLPGEPVNKLSRAVSAELVPLLERLEADASVTGIVLISGKPDMFVAGADIEEFLELRTAADAERMSREGQEMIGRLERGKPVVAAIDGACMGGGLELALACAYRVASDSPKTILALPEVQLGLIPGAGGTQRLPRLVGLPDALDMILTGKNVRAKKAYQLGLVDELVHPSILREVAVRRARELGAGTLSRPERRHGAREMLLGDNALGRHVVFNKAKDGVLAKTKGNFPAPLAAIEAVRAGYDGSKDDGFRTEARLFGEMAATEQSKQLIFLFFATTSLKRDRGVEGEAPKPRAVHKLGVLGAGFMGAGIASVAAPAGTLVRIKDAKHERVAAGLRGVREVVGERFRKRQVTRQQFEDTMSLVSGTVDYSGFGSVDLVIEAVFEDLAVKHQVLTEVEAVAPAHAIFATNTSTIPIAQIAEASARPENVIGMHFFSPVHKMPLLEVIVHPGTSAETTVTAVSYGRKLGKTVIVVNDGPGFFANRVLSPYINAAGLLLDEGVAIDAIDRALVQFGFPVGPITLIDEVGLDVATKAGAIMAGAFPERMSPAQSLQKVVAAGRLGRKSKQGFYTYDEAGKKGDVDEDVYALFGSPPRRELPAAEIVERCLYPMLNESVRCLEDRILRSARDGDVGAVFGIGFPPFRGGPFRYIDSIGAVNVVATLEALETRFPGRYEPAYMLRRMAAEGGRFYPAEGKPVA